MRIDRVLLSLIACVTCIVILSIPLGKIPPLAHFFNPQSGFFANGESEKDFISAELSAINHNVHGRVYVDDRLVPHIFAEDDYSAYFLEGYIHAKYRLWQMEIQTRAAAGRISEILGPDFIEFDRYQRRIGMVVGAENALGELKKDSATYSSVLAYTDGINYFIHSSNQDADIMPYQYRPLEYKLLNYAPEDWTPLKCMLLQKNMAITLSGFDDDVEYTNLIRMLGRKDFDLLFPDHPAEADPIIPSGTNYDFPIIHLDTALEYYDSTIYSHVTMRSTSTNGAGSNNWAVAPSKTKNGNAILCNDPHLDLGLPSLWYEVQIHTPTQNVYGVSLPGAPGVVIGFNDSISWGLTNAGRDVRDWYRIKWRIDENDLVSGVENPDRYINKNEYRYGDKWLPIEKHIEIIKVKGGQDVVDTVYWTVHGPLVYYGLENKDGNDWDNLAMRWAAIDSSNDFKAFYLLNRATNYNAYREAISYFSCPAQNFAFASVNGDIAITQQGKMAAKWPEQGRFILDGKDPQSEWQTYIPPDKNPYVLNPSRGFISSANQHPTDTLYPYYYTGFDFEYYRNRRINHLLSGMQDITVQDMEHMQQDNFNLKASEALPVMLSRIKIEDIIKSNDTSTMRGERFDDNLASEIFQSLTEWTYFNDPEQTAATYFQVWWDTLYHLLWDEFIVEGTALIPPDPYATISAMKTFDGTYYLFDIQSTSQKQESLSDDIRLSFEAAVRRIATISSDERAWYQYKNTQIMHLLKIPAFSEMQIVNGGYANIINATKHTNGPSWRMVVEMSKPVKGYGVYPGGQSGNPGSVYYDNFVEQWQDGKYFELTFYPDERSAKSNSQFTITFQ